MAGTQPTLTNDGPIPQAWTAVGQALQGNAALSSATALQTSQFVPDQFQNTRLIIGNLNQIVTIGAGWVTIDGSPFAPVQGVEVGTGIADFGLAYPTNFVYTTCTISSVNQAANQIVVASAAGLSNGMVIGATTLETSPLPENQAPPNYIQPGATITNISGTLITLSVEPLLTSSSALYCCACNWTALGSPVFP